MTYFRRLFLKWTFAPGIAGLMFFSFSVFAETRPTVRILTFLENDPWHAVQTVLAPEGEHFYRTEEIGALARLANKKCEDLLSKYQKRPLEVMLDNKYITRELFEELSNPAHRAQDMRQYVLVTLFEDMTQKEALGRGFTPEQFLDEPKGPGTVRVHLGSMYAVRGYDLERFGVDSFEIKKLHLPFENEGVPAPLTRKLDRQTLRMTVEIGRALVEKGADRKTFALLMRVLTGSLAADAAILNVPPEAVAVFGRADDATHGRLYSATLGGKPMTPEMQMQLERDPARALAEFASQPPPSRDYWSTYHEGVILGSLAQLIAKFPEEGLSSAAARLKAKYPSAAGAQALRLVRDLQFFNRQDFDFTWYDPHRPGQRAPLRLQDWGTGLLEVRVMRLFKEHGFDSRPSGIESLLKELKLDSLKGDPDFGQSGWLERSTYAGLPHGWTPQSGERLPSFTIENLDPTVKDKRSYLAQIILAMAAKIEADIASLSEFEHRLVLENMSEVRAKKGLAPVPRVSLRTFLETYDFNVGTSDEGLQTELKILGADLRQGIRIDNPFKGGHIDVQIDPTKLGIDLVEFAKNPEKFQPQIQAFLMNSLTSLFKPCKVYRFGWSEIVEMRTDYPQFAAGGTLAPSFHRQKIQRMYGAYQ